MPANTHSKLGFQQTRHGNRSEYLIRARAEITWRSSYRVTGFEQFVQFRLLARISEFSLFAISKIEGR